MTLALIQGGGPHGRLSFCPRPRLQVFAACRVFPHMDEDLAKEVNRHIAELGERFAVSEDGLTMQFFCQCGCLKSVPLTPEEFAAGDGAWLPGHARTYH